MSLHEDKTLIPNDNTREIKNKSLNQINKQQSSTYGRRFKGSVKNVSRELTLNGAQRVRRAQPEQKDFNLNKDDKVAGSWALWPSQDGLAQCIGPKTVNKSNMLWVWDCLVYPCSSGALPASILFLVAVVEPRAGVGKFKRPQRSGTAHLAAMAARARPFSKAAFRSPVM